MFGMENTSTKQCIILPSRLGTEKIAMYQVEPFLDRLGLSKSRSLDIQTIVSEACLNAIEHGNYFDEQKSYEIELCYQNHTLIIRVYDQGRSREWTGVPQFRSMDDVIRSEDEPRGWGLQIIDSLADAWAFYIREEAKYLQIEVGIDSKFGGEIHESGY